MVVGKKGSGKSYLAVQLLLTAWCKVYDRIIIISPTFAAQFKSLWYKIHPDGLTIYNDLTESLLHLILKDVSAGKDNVLLILDDLGEEFKRIDPRTVNLLIANSRHYKLSMLCLFQKLTQAPTIMRCNADCIIAFSSCSYIEVEALWKLVSKLPRKEFHALFARSTEGKRAYMVSLVDKYGSLKFYGTDFKTELK